MPCTIPQPIFITQEIIALAASRATSSSQGCSYDIQYKMRIHQQPLHLREYINDHLPARSLRSTNKVLLSTASTKTETAARAFRAAAPKYETVYLSQSRQQHHSTSSVACLKDTCSAMPLSDRHSYPAPLHRRLN